MDFEYRILGPLEVRKSGRALRLGGARQRAILALLLLHANEPVSVEQLVVELWGTDPPSTAAKMVHNNVSRLRKLLQPDGSDGRFAQQVLATRASGYELQVGRDQLDANRFEAIVEEARQALDAGAADVAAAKFREALALWRGPALAEFGYETFAQTAIDRLEELRLTALEGRIEADLALGRHSDLVGELDALVTQHPLRERLRAHLMLALYRSGRQAEALAVYHKTRHLLVEQLGIEPTRELQHLERAILRQDPSLEVEPRQRAQPGAGPAGGEPTEPPSRETREVRKMVSVVFAELTTLGRQLDPEAARRPLSSAVATASRVLGRYGATVRKLRGRAVVGMFGVPVVNEDDPVRATQAAVAARASISALNEELTRGWGVRVAVRTAVVTGEVVVRETAAGPEVVAGDAVDDAAHLQQAAAPDEIVVADSTRPFLERIARLEPLEPPPLKGPNGVDGWRLIELVEQEPRITGRIDVPMVGRERELAQLRQAFAHAVRDRTPYLFTVLGTAGIGKTRLAAEFAASIEHEATILTGRCLPYGEAITFWPLVEMVRQVAGDDLEQGIAEIVEVVENADEADLVAERVAAAIGVLERANPREETFWAMRKLFEAMATDRPVVLVFEDLHWAEPTLLDLIEHLADWARDASIVLLCLGRPELLDGRPAWGGGKLNATAILLAPLGAREAEELIEKLVGEGGLPRKTMAEIAEAADGNPLFLEQMVAMLSDHASAEGQLRIPPTVQAVLAARLDRLGSEERAVLERASVVGKEFSRAALADLSPDEVRDSLDDHLQALVRRELITPHRSLLPGDEAYRFRHILLREAAYESVPKEARSRLHERFATSLGRAAGARAREFEEIVGYHLEQAHRYEAELGPAGERARALARRAFALLASAGRRAHARGDLPAAAGLLLRARNLLEPGAPGAAELLIDLAEALRETGDHEQASAVLDEAAEAAARAEDEALASDVQIARLRLQVQTDRDITTEELLREAERCVEVFERLGDERRLAKAWALLAWVPWYRCQAAAAAEAVREAVDHARRAGDTRAEAQGLHLLAGALLFGPMPAAEAIAQCREILAQPGTQRRVEADVLRALAGLEAMQGELDGARRDLRRCRTLLNDLGLTVTAATVAETAAIVEMLAGDPTAAERELRDGYAILEEMGETTTSPVLAALLAHALHAQGRDDDALRFAELSQENAAPDDLFAHVQARAARAKVLAHGRNLKEAEVLAREAVALAGGTDFLVVHGDALTDLAIVLLQTDRAPEAVPALEQALRLYELKGNAVGRAQAEQLLASASQVDAPLR